MNITQFITFCLLITIATTTMDSQKIIIALNHIHNQSNLVSVSECFSFHVLASLATSNFFAAPLGNDLLFWKPQERFTINGNYCVQLKELQRSSSERFAIV